jgi:hypothetical protein
MRYNVGWMMRSRTPWLFAAMLVVAACRSEPTRTVSRDVPPVSVEPADATRTRIVAFAGGSVELPAIGNRGPYRVAPALPDGIAVDPATGAVTGVARAPAAPALYTVSDADDTERMIHVEIVAQFADGDRFVAPAGDDAGDGSRARPFRTIRRALDGVVPGTRIFLAGGRYAEDVRIVDVAGTADQPIVIRSLPGELARIEGEQAAIDWKRATGANAAPDEWVSAQTFERTSNRSYSRAAFADRHPYTRLLTYSEREDLRATNQRWARDGSAPGNVTARGVPRPWTYMGPGLWHDPATGHVHLRLSPTANRVAGLDDYSGPTDPSRIAVAVWSQSSQPLEVRRSSFLELRDLRIVGGGERTAIVGESSDITFDHVDVHASTMGLVIGKSSRVRFLHGRLDGGVPPWTFRSDFKDNYKIEGDDGSVDPNNLVRKTSRALLFVTGGNREIEIAYSEIENAHDVYMAGVDSSLHHCRIRNIHDEALFVGHTEDIDNLQIHHNVIERVLTAVSAQSQRPSGSRLVYRNVFDLRDPTPSFRPGAGDSPWRWGHMFKSGISASFYFYQNTLQVSQIKQGKPALIHFRRFERDGVATNPRWFVNNLVVVGGKAKGQLAVVPDDTHRAAKAPSGQPLLFSDGNAWIWMGDTPPLLFRCVGPRGTPCKSRGWSSLDDVRATGFERRSRFATTPGFRRMQSIDHASPDDDLRPAPKSPALGTAIELPPELPGAGGAAGALDLDAPPLHVGVDGRRTY